MSTALWVNDRDMETEFGLIPSSLSGWWDPVGAAFPSFGLSGRMGNVQTDRGHTTPARRIPLVMVHTPTTLAGRKATLTSVVGSLRGTLEVRVADDPERVAYGTLSTGAIRFTAPQMVVEQIIPTYDLVFENPAKYDRRHQIVVATGTAGAVVPTGSLPHRGRLWIMDTLTSRTIEVVTPDGVVVGQLRLTGTLAAAEYLEIDMDRDNPSITRVTSGGTIRQDAFSWLNPADAFLVFDPADAPRIRHTGGGTVVCLYRRAWSE